MGRKKYFVNNKPVLVRLTYPILKEFVLHPRWEGDRTLDERRGQLRKAQLTRALYDGTLHTIKWCIVRYHGNDIFPCGTAVRINGETTSSVLMEAYNSGLWKELVEDPGIYVVIDYADAYTQYELADIFGKFDHVLSSRSNRDNLKANITAAGDALSGCTLAATEHMVKGIKLYLKVRYGDQKINIDESKLVHHFPEFISEFNEFARIKYMQNQGVQAGIFSLFVEDPVKAYEFCRHVVDRTGEKPCDMTRLLEPWLRDSKRIQRIAKDNRHTIPRIKFKRVMVAFELWLQRCEDASRFRERPNFPSFLNNQDPFGFQNLLEEDEEETKED